MLVRVSSPYGWVEQDLPEHVAHARIAGGTAFALEGATKREVAMVNRAVERSTQVSKKPLGRAIADFTRATFGLCVNQG